MPKTIIAEGKTSTEAIEKGLKELMKRISQNKVDKVVVFYKDRATRTC